MGFNLKDYQPVEERNALFWDRYPTGRILTDLVFDDGQRYVVRCEVYTDRDDTRPAATGFAEEHVSNSGVNKTSALENCETSAEGRALARLGFAPKGARPSREEMEKVQRRQELPKDPAVYRDRAVSVGVTVEQLRELHAAASAAGVLGAEVTDADGAPTTLGDLIVARGKALAPKAAA